MRHCYPVVATVLSFVSRLFPFSLLDVLFIASVVLFILGVVLLLLHRLSLRRWIRTTVLALLWLPAWFYMSWGVGYFRPDFYARSGMLQQTADKEFFETFVLRYIDSLNCAYPAVKDFNANAVNKEIERQYGRYRSTLLLPYPCGTRRIKHTIAEPLMTRMGVSGYFDPFFNEVHLNGFLLPESYPFTLAHEKAHQLGIASEAECNFFASVVCTASDHPLVKYSGYLQTVSYLLGGVRRISPDEYRRIYGQIDARIIVDYRRIREHWQKKEHRKLSDMQYKIYDVYLKTNKQRSGVLSYSEMVGLLVAWDCKK
jgi:hypothetical protein